MSAITKKYKIGLEYLRKTGFDHIVFEIGPFGSEVYKYKPHSRFDSEKKDLPNPCQFGEIVLTKKMMDHYQIKTKVDIARYLRIISIILTHFSLPDEYDNFDIHRRELRRHFQDDFYKNVQRKQSAIREALVAYDEAFSSPGIIPVFDYDSFADLLDRFYNIYKPTPKLTDEQSDAIKELIHGLKKKPITAEDDYDDFGFYDETPTEDFDYSAHSNWIFEVMFKDFTDEKLIKELKSDKSRKTLEARLKDPLGIKGYSDRKLKELLNNKLERKKLVLKIRNWHSKNYPKKK